MRLEGCLYKVDEFSHVFAEGDLRDQTLRTLRAPLGNPFLQKDLVELRGTGQGNGEMFQKCFSFRPMKP